MIVILDPVIKSLTANTGQRTPVFLSHTSQTSYHQSGLPLALRANTSLFHNSLLPKTMQDMKNIKITSHVTHSQVYENLC